MNSACRRAEVEAPRRRRKRVRYSRSWPLAVFEPNRVAGVCVAAALHNASAQGIAFLTHRRFDVGATVLVRLFWHDDQSPQVPAVIRHVTATPDGYLVGCEFDPYWSCESGSDNQDGNATDTHQDDSSADTPSHTVHTPAASDTGVAPGAAR